MVIARIKNFALVLSSYISEHKYTTHDIQIVKYQNSDFFDDSESCYTIASFNKDGDLVSCGNRLLEAFEDSYEDIEAVKKLADIGLAILETDCVESGYGEMLTFKSKQYSSDEKTPIKVRKYPVEKNLGVYEVVGEDSAEYGLYWNEEDAKLRAAELNARDGKEEFMYVRAQVN